jgi:hypothetical protein
MQVNTQNCVTVRRLIEEGYYIPGLSMHFFLFFMPALLLCEWSLKIFWAIVLLSGPFLLDRMVSCLEAAWNLHEKLHGSCLEAAWKLPWAT